MSVVPSTVARATSVRSASEPASGPPGQPTDVERLANLTKANPAAAAAARALITAGHSIGKAVEWMEKAIQPTPGSNTPPAHRIGASYFNAQAKREASRAGGR
ncbi:unnamed protein product [Tilletia laevis]|uniref:Uncharacterized protein n=2 Tax=Tilletia TaxID=13289 RepID=A0A9N8LVR7_9BASI